MNYTAQQIDHLAAEYVLGTLRGGARRRFDQLIAGRADVRMTVWRWERYLNAFAGGVSPQQPPRRVWQEIRRRIGPREAANTPRFSWWRTLGVALPAAIAAVWITVIVLPIQSFDRVAIFSSPQATALWVVSADLENRLVRIESVEAEASPKDKSYELWILPAAGPPLSLGLLATGQGTIEVSISANLVNALDSAGSLAISLEPAGGSPTGQPTGPVVYQASLVSI